MYPATPRARDRFVLERRPARTTHDPWRYQALIVEDERAADGRLARVATVLLTGRECPWRCAMCDLWKSTLESDTPPGAIPRQVAEARQELARRSEAVAQLKLYNAGSFFDPRAVPEHDYRAVAERLSGLDRVIVESHPSLIGPRVDRFIDALVRHALPPAHLEVAMGLETANPEALERLHKRMTLDDFRRASDALRRRGVSLRAFLLISPPFIPPTGQDGWFAASLAEAVSYGASVVSLIPTRAGNGTLEALASQGLFKPPTLDDIERSVARGFDWLSRQEPSGPRVRLFVDLWDLRRFAACADCFDRRRARLHDQNLSQRALPPVACLTCGAAGLQ